MHIFDYENTHEIKTHGNLNFPFNIYPCSIPLDFSSVPAHWHNDMEIIYIKKGQGLIFVDLKSYPVSAGDIVFICPGQVHSIQQLELESMEYENIIFQLSMLMSPGGDLCSQQFFSPLLHNGISLPVHLAASSDYYPKAAAYLDEIDKLSGYGDALSALGIKGQLFGLFHLLFCHFSGEILSAPPSRSLEYVKIILKHVETHYQEPLSIEDMAKLCGFSCSHFMKFFKQSMGVSFIQYLNDYRLTMAARMLSSSQDTIVTIAEEIGFENLSYFNRLFKRRFGMTPSQYRSGNAS